MQLNLGRDAVVLTVEVCLSLVLLTLAVPPFFGKGARVKGTLQAAGQIAVGSASLRDLGGLDYSGNFVGFRRRSAGERFAAFVIRGASARADCAYWDRVVALMSRQRMESRIRVAAYCNSLSCAKIASQLARFPVIAFAENVDLLQALRLDRGGDALEIDARGQAVRIFRWRGISAMQTTKLLEAAR